MVLESVLDLLQIHLLPKSEEVVLVFHWLSDYSSGLTSQIHFQSPWMLQLDGMSSHSYWHMRLITNISPINY